MGIFLLLLFLPAFLCVPGSDFNTVIVSVENVRKEIHYDPTWDSLDSRPLPSWYDEAKFGIFLHWGVFSVPSFGSEWFWWNWNGGNVDYVNFMKSNYPPEFRYQDFGRDLTAEFFKPDEWATLFQKSGAKYVVLTSKHHEGFTLFPSKHTFGWNAVDIGPHRDLLGDLADAIRQNTSVKFGLYYSLFEWFNPLYLSDRKHLYLTNDYSRGKMLPELKDLVSKYKPEIIFSDGDWEAPDAYFHSKEFLAWLYNDSPVKETIVVNDRWGQNISCHHGGYYTCQDRYNPGVLQDHKWENAMTIDKQSWGFRRESTLADYLTIEELLETLATTVSCGGNLLMNVGPTKEGTIAPIFEERLLQMGEWLDLNGEAIYASKPWIHQNETDVRVWYTFNNDAVYAICLDWPDDGVLALANAREVFVQDKTVVEMLSADKLQWTITDDDKRVNILFPDRARVKGKWSWVLKITN